VSATPPVVASGPPTKPWWQSRTVWTGITLIVIPALSVAVTLLGDGTPFDRKDAALVLVAALGGLVTFFRVTAVAIIGPKDPAT
jgi:hypothetical protein